MLPRRAEQRVEVFDDNADVVNVGVTRRDKSPIDPRCDQPEASRQAEDAQHLATEHRVAAQELETQRTHGAGVQGP